MVLPPAVFMAAKTRVNPIHAVQSLLDVLFNAHSDMQWRFGSIAPLSTLYWRPWEAAVSDRRAQF
eukprot:UN4530